VTRLLLVGGGGREHALAWRLRQDDPDLELIAAPGNPGIAELATCVPVSATDLPALLALASAQRVDAVVVGPEGPLAAGLVDALRQAGIPAFGPTAAAARIETSKRFAKDLMQRAGVPTAAASMHRDSASAIAAARALGAPVVVKASGLAAGKGVVVAMSLADAEQAIRDIMDDRTLGEAGAEVLIEEYMTGEELSLFVITDGTHAIPLVAAQDHKRLLAGDLGPNTGGMGAYAPVALSTPALLERVMREIITPTLDALRAEGAPFTGLLYAGLMLTPTGPKVVEFNCRFGDPETQVVLPLVDGPFLETVLRVARGESLADAPPRGTRPGAAVTTVLAAAGYPAAARTGDVISVPALPPEVMVFHAGTTRAPDGTLRSAGGRVLAVTAVAPSFAAAQALSRTAADALHFEGAQSRSDIGWREAARSAGTP
jgi:phosphoribosylamine---glycine ligase